MQIYQPSARKADIRPIEFVVAVVVGSIGSAALSALHVHPLISVGFALLTMGILTWLRWQSVATQKDFESLEAFAEDVYLLGYLLTLAALLGLAPRLMSENTNLFNIAGLKLVTTVAGLAMMMILRQVARRWAQDCSKHEEDDWRHKQQVFTEAVDLLNKGADQLTAKLDEVVRKFDPELLNPVAEWSNKAAAAFSAATTHLNSVPASVLNGIRHLDALNANLEQVRTSATELSRALAGGTVQAANKLVSELGQATQAVSSLGAAVAVFQPSGQVVKGAFESLGTQAQAGADQLIQVCANLASVTSELSRLESSLKGICDLHKVDPAMPLNRLVEALDKSASQASATSARVEVLNEGLQSMTSANKEVALRIENHVSTPLAEHQKALDRSKSEMARITEVLEQLAKQLARGKSDGEVEGSAIKELLVEMKETNSHLKSLSSRGDGRPEVNDRSWLPWRQKR